MKLEHLHYECCPHCKSPVVAERRWDQHSNGSFNEYQEFACRALINWNPNFQEEGVGIACKESPEAKLRKKQRAAAQERLLALLDELEVDDLFKNNIRDKIKSFYWF